MRAAIRTCVVFHTGIAFRIRVAIRTCVVFHASSTLRAFLVIASTRVFNYDVTRVRVRLNLRLDAVKIFL